MATSPLVKKSLHILKISGIALSTILVLMFLLPILFPGTVSKKIKQWTNNTINGELNFSKARLSFFNHFPSLTLTLYDFTLKGAAPFEKDTLVSANEVSLGINLKSIFSDKIGIDEIYVTNGDIDVKVDSLGRANYNVYKGDTTKAAQTDTSQGSASLKIDRIQLDNTDIHYNDQSLKMQIAAKNLNYLGKGDLTEAIFDLTSQVAVESFDFTFNNAHYITSKKLKANLITKVNTSSLAFVFEKNEISLNKLPLDFKGTFAFVKDGYDMDFNINTVDADLYDVLAAIPADYAPWFAKMDAKGKTEVNFSLKGKYEAALNVKPNVLFGIKIRDGYLDHEKAPSPLTNLYLDFSSSLPKLNMDSMHVDVDSLSFAIDKSYLKSDLHVVGLDTPYIKAHLNAELDLAKLQQAVGIKGLEMKGKYVMNGDAAGKYFSKIVTYTTGKIRKEKHQDTVLASIPSFKFTSSFSDGYIKYPLLPKALEHLAFNLNAICPDNDYKHTEIDMQNINATVLDNYIKGFIKLKGATIFNVDADLKGMLRLSDIPDFYPLDSSIKLKGNLLAEVQAKGTLDMAKKIYPVVNANFNLKDGSIKTKYYPHPIEQIQVSAKVVSKSASPKDVSISILPISLVFEGQPFSVKADMKNLTNVKYNITSNGTIDIGKIYQVFAIKGYGIKGLVRADLALRGLQSDATAGLYGKLFNKGSLQLKDVLLTSEFFPKPFTIQDGVFHFDQDRMIFDKFRATYGKSDFTLNGYLNNVVNYALKDTAVLKGNFDLKSNYLNVDEFMAYAGTPSTPAAPATAAKGVVVIPKNLDISFNANITKTNYQGINIDSIKGQLVVDSGSLKMVQSGFMIVGARAVMDATYHSLTANKALFDFKVNAQDFDIKKAYDGIPMFRQMATSAKSVKGIVSLDYQLTGRLDENMHPVLPSIKGGGVLSLKSVKLKGFKLMDEVGKATEKDALTDPDLSKVNIKTTIANNIMTIERTKMKIAGFRPRFEGQVSLDGKLNLKGRIGLPPLGIFGVPFNVTGTQAKPVVKLRRGNDTDSLHVTEDVDDK